jgi:hypothetical protein
MTPKIFLSTITLALVAAASTAMADHARYSCKLLTRPTVNHPWGKVNQVIVNDELDRIELKEQHDAATNPTPYNWVFENGIVGTHNDKVLIETQKDGFFGTGLAKGVAYTFALTNDGRLRWVFVESKLMYQVEWQCTKLPWQ